MAVLRSFAQPAAGRTPFVEQVRRGTTVLLVGLLALSGYGSVVPADLRCASPGAVGCPGGFLGVVPAAGNSSLTMWFNVTMPDYGFWIINTVDGSNESASWTVFEGYTIHINATSLKPDPSVGGEAYHGIGVELNATGQQLLDLSAPVGKWVHSSFLAPARSYYRQHIWCTIGCGPGHSGMQLHNLNIVPASSLPSVAVTASLTSGPAPLAVALRGSVSGGNAPYQYRWDFGDGSAAATSAAVNHTYDLSGAYTAVLTATDSANHTATGSVGIAVGTATPLAVTVHASAANGTVPLLVTLVASASGGVVPYQFTWSLGDGTNVTSPNSTLTHLYVGAGLYGVTLSVSDAVGTSTSAALSIGVRAPATTIPVTVAANPPQGPAPLTVNLSAAAPAARGATTTTWIFGDGTFAAGDPIQHTYALPGHYTVLGYVADAAGDVGANVTSVVVSGPAPGGLRVLLEAVPSAGSAPLAVEAAASGLGGSLNFTQVAWTFGDGATGSGWATQHTYGSDGAYDLSVRLTDSTGGTATASQVVLVRSLAIAITLNRTSGDSPFQVGAAATVVGGSGTYGPVTWSWDDGSNSVGATANHTYGPNVLGALWVNATVTDSLGTVASASVPIQIQPGPVAHLAATVTVGYSVPITVTFDLTVSGGQPPYSPLPLWTFGDGATTRGGSPQSHTFDRFGHFRVTVDTNDSLGTNAAASVWVNLSAPGSNVNGGSAVWTFTGIGAPNDAALVLLGLAAVTGLFLLHRKRIARSLAGPATRPTRPTDAPPAPRGPRRAEPAPASEEGGS